MGPNPVVGTNTGQTYIGQEGDGIAPIFGPSRAADTYVTMRREQLAFERQTQAQQAAQAQAERKKAQEKLMTTPEHYVKYDTEVMGAIEDSRMKYAELSAAGVNDPFAPSKDPEVIAFRKQWDDAQAMAQTSLLIKEMEEENRKLLTAKGAEDELDVEGYTAELGEWSKMSLLDMRKNINNFPSPKDRYGIVKATNQLSTYVKTITADGQPPTEQQLYDAAVAYAADPTNARGIQTMMPKDGLEGLTQRASESGSRDLKVQTVLEAMKGMVKAPKDYLTYIKEEALKFKQSTTPWGSNVKENKARVRQIAAGMMRNNPNLYTYKDVDGQPVIPLGKNEAETFQNGVNKLAEDLYVWIGEERKDPLAVARFNAKQKTQEGGFTWEDLDQGVRQAEGKATSYLGGQKLPNGGTFEKVEFIKSPTAPFANGYKVSYYGPAWGETNEDDTDTDNIRRTIILDERQWKELSFPLYMEVTSKKQAEGLKPAETIEDFVEPKAAELD